MKDNRRPIFSIIVPVYNVEEYLDECILSVMNQTFDDYELILVDDGSKDSSLKICQKYENKYFSKIKVFHKENEGLLLTRQYGIDKASGKYIISLDSDDYLRKDALERVYATIIKFNSDMIIYNASRKTDFSDKWVNHYLEENKVIEIRELYNAICSTMSLNNMALKCFKREYYPSAEYLKNYRSIQQGEDLIQSLYIIDKCQRPVLIDESLYYYRENQSSITYTLKKDFFSSLEAIGLLLLEYAKKWGNGEDFYIKKVYVRNLFTCANAIKRVICLKNKSERMQFYIEIHSSDFFSSVYKEENLRKLRWEDRLILLFCKNRMYFIFEFMHLLKS